MRVNKIQLALASLAILVASALTFALAPRPLQASDAHDLDALIPTHFGIWTFDPSIRLVTASAETPAGSTTERQPLFGIYSQVVGRGYRDADGDVVMLVVAYGPAQDFQLKAHRPELCYIASGFRISDKSEAEVRYRDDARPIRVTRLTTLKGSRLEPVSYWMRVGDTVTRGVVERQVARLRYGLRGEIPDGALIRTSTVGLPADASFRLQDRFIRDLLAAVPAEDLQFFTGSG
jgi:EpsI family protein